MRSIILVLAVLLLAVPSMAAVTVTATDAGNDDGWVTISYVQDDVSAGKLPRAFGLDIVASDGEICAVDATGCQPFGVYMGTIVIDAEGVVTNPGTPVAPAGAPGSAGALGTGAVTIEMGSLYDAAAPGGDQPALSGDLLKVKVNKSCTLSVVANAARATGGVVLEDGTTPGATLNAGAVNVVYGGPDYAEWNAVGSPASWGNANQCHGDINGADEKYGFKFVSVGFADIPLFTGAFLKPIGDAAENLDADLDHAKEKYGFKYVRTGFNDIPVFVEYFLDINTTMPSDCQSCQPVNP